MDLSLEIVLSTEIVESHHVILYLALVHEAQCWQHDNAQPFAQKRRLLGIDFTEAGSWIPALPHMAD